ncbi:MAG: DNA-3-methyladenine glycosylase family protein [Streptosporangiaceae bacterium]
MPGVGHPPHPLDTARGRGVHPRGRSDPALRIEPGGAIWRTSLTPDGPGTLRVAAQRLAGGTLVPLPRPGRRTDRAAVAPPRPTLVTAAAWGPGAGWLLDQLPELLGERDNPDGFVPGDRLLARLTGRFHGPRVSRSARVFEALVPAVLEQKVVGLEAKRAWRLLLTRFGLPAPGPGPAGLRVCPPPAVWAALPSWEWHRAGVEGVRAVTIARAARVAGRLEEIVTMPAAAADTRLRSLPGIGPWTSAEVRQRACGDPDAVTVGDLHLPGAVGWTLAGRVVDDAGMLDLLAPYRGHRYRVTRLVVLGGSYPPRRGPRMPVRDYRAF